MTFPLLTKEGFFRESLIYSVVCHFEERFCDEKSCNYLNCLKNKISPLHCVQGCGSHARNDNSA